MRVTVRFHAGPYSGTRTVEAEDHEHAIAKVRSLVRREMSLPMYYESYCVIDAEEEAT